MKYLLQLTGLGLVLPLFFGCARYDVSPDLNNEFKSMVSGYETQVEKMAETDKKHQIGAPDRTTIPTSDKTFVADLVGKPIYAGSTLIPANLEELYVSALKNSSQIKVFSDVPLIRETGIQEAQGAFDTHFFTEALYNRANDPVGNTLTTGGPARYIDDKYTLESGYKKKLNTGADVTLSQSLGYENNNSVFFSPNQQGTGTAKLRIVQPLLNGAGFAYNASIIQIAELDSDIARNEFIRQTESHLLEVTRTYWTVYLTRANYVQRKQLAQETKTTLDELDARKNIDTIKRQLLRARGVYAERNAELVRAEASVRNAQDRLQALLNDPTYAQQTNYEIIPKDQPLSTEIPVDIRTAAISALKNRPEIAQGFIQLKAAAIRERMQNNEILPSLNLVMEGSLKGLTGEGRVPAAAGNEYAKGGPGYVMGLIFDVPIENNAADARYRRRLLELRQQFQQLTTTIETILLEVKVSVREMRTSYKDLQAKYATLLAAREELEDLKARRTLEVGSDDVPTSTYLDTLIDSQDRRMRAEEEFLRALATYNVAITTLERAKGVLLSYEKVKVVRTLDENNLPSIEVKKTSVTTEPVAGLRQESKTRETTHKLDPDSFPYRDAIPKEDPQSIEGGAPPATAPAASGLPLPTPANAPRAKPVEVPPGDAAPVTPTPIEVK